MKAKVNKDTCIGCGLCSSICEQVFEMDDDAKAIAKVSEFPKEKQDEARDAKSSCPVDAITLD